MSKKIIIGVVILILFLFSYSTFINDMNAVKTATENEDVKTTAESYGFFTLNQIVGWIQSNIILFIVGIVLSVLLYAGFIKK